MDFFVVNFPVLYDDPKWWDVRRYMLEETSPEDSDIWIVLEYVAVTEHYRRHKGNPIIWSIA